MTTYDGGIQANKLIKLKAIMFSLVKITDEVPIYQRFGYNDFLAEVTTTLNTASNLSDKVCLFYPAFYCSS